MSKKTKNIVEVKCFLTDKELCSLEWDEMPNTGMSFYHEKKEYQIIKIKDSKITLKDITKLGSKNQ